MEPGSLRGLLKERGLSWKRGLPARGESRARHGPAGRRPALPAVHPMPRRPEAEPRRSSFLGRKSGRLPECGADGRIGPHPGRRRPGAVPGAARAREGGGCDCRRRLDGPDLASRTRDPCERRRAPLEPSTTEERRNHRENPQGPRRRSCERCPARLRPGGEAGFGQGHRPAHGGAGLAPHPHHEGPRRQALQGPERQQRRAGARLHPLAGLLHPARRVVDLRRAEVPDGGLRQPVAGSQHRGRLLHEDQ